MFVWKTASAVGMLVVGWVKCRGQLSLWNMLVLISVTRPNRVMNQHKAQESPDWAAASSTSTFVLNFDYAYCLCKHLLPPILVYGWFSKVPELWLLSEEYSHMGSRVASSFTEPRGFFEGSTRGKAVYFLSPHDLIWWVVPNHWLHALWAIKRKGVGF